MSLENVEGGTHKGKENVRQWLAKLWIYEEIAIDVEEASSTGKASSKPPGCRTSFL